MFQVSAVDTHWVFWAKSVTCGFWQLKRPLLCLSWLFINLFFFFFFFTYTHKKEKWNSAQGIIGKGEVNMRVWHMHTPAAQTLATLTVNNFWRSVLSDVSPRSEPVWCCCECLKYLLWVNKPCAAVVWVSGERPFHDMSSSQETQTSSDPYSDAQISLQLLWPTVSRSEILLIAQLSLALKVEDLVKSDSGWGCTQTKVHISEFASVRCSGATVA